MKFLWLLILSTNVFALEIIKPDYTDKDIHLNIVRAYPASWETFTLVNSNSREMMLVCAKNRIFDHNKRPFIEYRNFYNVKVARFSLPNDKVCRELSRFIEASHMAIDEDDGFKITLSRKDMSVKQIVYPNIDPFSDTGEFEDLFHKKKIIINIPDNIEENRMKKGPLN